MTSNDQRIETAPTDLDAQAAADPADQQGGHTDSSREEAGLEPGVAPGTDSNLPNAESSSEKPLFAEESLTSLRARWGEVQAVFVDDPRACVQKADGLVADAIGQLVNGFADARSHLERQWGRGEEASTEDLRVALKRYREFFDRLLTV